MFHLLIVCKPRVFGINGRDYAENADQLGCNGFYTWKVRQGITIKQKIWDSTSVLIMKIPVGSAYWPAGVECKYQKNDDHFAEMDIVSIISLQKWLKAFSQLNR